MASSKYSDLFPYVLTELAGVSSLQAEAQIRASVIDFCRRSKVWNSDEDATPTEARTASYDIVPPSGAALVEIKALYIDGEPLDPSPSGFAGTQNPGTPESYRQPTPESVLLSPTPDAAYSMTMTLTLAPSRISSVFPGWIAEKYFDAIVAGAKSRLMAQPGQVWTNVQQSMYYRAIFDAAVTDAQADASRSFTRAPVRTTPQY